MALATLMFEKICKSVRPDVFHFVPRKGSSDFLYWRRVLRLAALCHDLGHLPFSHAAEKDLLPEGWSHEDLTKAVIQSDEMRLLWNAMTPPIRVDDIVKLAVGPKKLTGTKFSNWE